jgi:hypothetical protein
MHVIEGEGAVHTPGSRGSRPLTVEVTDETGRPVAGATVSFHTPVDGPSALFLSGLRTEILSTDANGRATVRGLQANREPGRFLVRIVATKEQARVGSLSSQYIAEPKTSSPAARGKSGSGGKKRWMAILSVVGGGAAAGYWVAANRSSSPSSPAAPPVTIGSPVITIGKP